MTVKLGPNTYIPRQYTQIKHMPDIYQRMCADGSLSYGWRINMAGGKQVHLFGYDDLDKCVAACNIQRRKLAGEFDNMLSKHRRVKMELQALFSQSECGDKFEIPMHDETTLQSQNNLIRRVAIQCGFMAKVSPRHSVFIVEVIY